MSSRVKVTSVLSIVNCSAINQRLCLLYMDSVTDKVRYIITVNQKGIKKTLFFNSRHHHPCVNLAKGTQDFKIPLCSVFKRAKTRAGTDQKSNLTILKLRNPRERAEREAKRKRRFHRLLTLRLVLPGTTLLHMVAPFITAGNVRYRSHRPFSRSKKEQLIMSTS